MHRGAYVRSSQCVGLHNVRYIVSQPCYTWMRVLRRIVIICRSLHPAPRNSLHRGLSCPDGLGLQLVYNLLGPHLLRLVRRAAWLLLLRRNCQLRRLPVQQHFVRLPQGALHIGGRLLELWHLLNLQLVLHMRCSVDLRVLWDELDERRLHPQKWCNLRGRLYGSCGLVVLLRRRPLRGLLGLRGVQRRVGLCLLRHVCNERILQDGQLHLEQLLRPQCGCLDCGGLCQPGDMRLLHVTRLHKVRLRPGMLLLRLKLPVGHVHSNRGSPVPGLL